MRRKQRGCRSAVTGGLGRAGGVVLLITLVAVASQHAGAPETEATRGKGMRVVAGDTGVSDSPIPFWGKIDCETDDRHQLIEGGDDPWATATGAPQGNDAFRRLTVFDGDDYWGERCELGFNSNTGRVAFYREGRRRITYISIRLPSNFPLHTEDWQGVMQMKQAQPADNGSGPPALSLSAYDGRWMLWHSPPGNTFQENLLWSRPAKSGAWTRFAFDIRYSRTRKGGRVKVYVDLTGDLDFADPGEQSRRMRTSTLKAEISGTPSDGLRQGQSIPSHLRAGIYHNDVIDCAFPQGCSTDIDNVQVLAP